MPIPTIEMEPAASARPETRLPAGPIIVAADGTEDSDGAVQMAWTLAGRTGADVQVVSVLEPLPTATELAAMANVAGFKAEQREAQLTAVRAQVARLLPAECEWPVTMIEGVAAATLANHVASQRARLLVMGRGRHRIPRRLLGGENVLRALRFGDTPVLAVEPDTTTLPKRVVVAVDFSAYSIYAARAALSIVAPDALVYLVHVRPHARFPGLLSARWEHQYAAAVPAVLEGVRDRVAAGPDMQVESIVLSGPAAPALIDFASSAAADLIVAGTHGYGLLNRLVLGSVTTELLREAPCSLLCVPGSALTHTAARDDKIASLRANALAKEAWAPALDEFSRRFEGEPCTLEWMPGGGSTRTIELGHPFVGAVYDEHDAAVSLMTGAARFDGPHTTHFVSDVRSIDELRDGDAELRGLRVLGRQGTTSLRLLP
jgi:nucleotide-binding universal stress UspA family protein